MLTPKQLREKLVAKRAQVGDLFEHKTTDDDGAPVYDFQAVEADWLPDDVAKLKGSAKSMRICELVREQTAECDDLQDQVAKLEEAELAGKAFEKAAKEPAKRVTHPEGKKAEYKSFGERVTEHATFKRWQEGSKDGKIALDMGLAEIKALYYKTLFERTAGWAPESIRTGIFTDAVTRPPQVTDIMPTGNTGMAAVLWMLETTRTHAAAETTEGAAYPESEFVVTQQTSPVQKIADSIPVTDEQLEDVPMVDSYLNGRLLFGVEQRLDQQIISGNGAAPNLDGILNTGGIQTQARGADPVPDAIFKAMTLVRVTGRAMPTHTLMHPTDWEKVRLLRTADGVYIWGNPSEAGPERIWGLPVVQNESLTVTGALVGSFMPAWIMLWERRGIVVERGFVDGQFTEGEQTIRASGRWALTVQRPAAFCTVTGLPA